ncbi:NCS2 family permease [Niveispirillum cyanobacteriorum]|uniref:Guanine permease n=1 Tax=Niveispirillum cyanobacteriorum TaxID=1612173 RepID=A0A2K9N7A2_9PROT|nr:NCS2 family permease [Niveispirillum cyanobacteriorum]AUN28964.1 guanine permease [Niveispirillum cyanobacteriorum]GGE68753.1 transporter [Niveispirillum cyanobacteriorum]
MLTSYFKLKELGSDVRTELLAGLTTFLTMAYIIFVNPQILSAAGMDHGAVFVATCVAAAIGSAIMGLYANYPIAQAPGMGLNAYFAFTVVGQMGYSWQVALGAVFLSGILFIILSVLPVREAVVNAIPRTLKMAISAGIGLFLAIIALENAGLIKAHPVTLVTMGDLTKPQPVLAAIGFILLCALAARKVMGSVILTILVIAIVGMVIGASPFNGQIISLPPDPSPTFLAMDLKGAFSVGLITVVFAFFFVDLFDTAGTLIGVSHRAGLLDKDGKLPRLKRALFADAAATTVGAALGTSTVTSYIESAAGTNVGGRSGLTAVTVAVLFVACLFFAPLAANIPAYATAPALLYIACLMARGLTEVDWEDVTDYAPAVMTAIAMPLTYSIAHGIAIGFITYAGIKILSGRWRDVGPVVAVLAALFLLKFILLA